MIFHGQTGQTKSIAATSLMKGDTTTKNNKKKQNTRILKINMSNISANYKCCKFSLANFKGEEIKIAV